MELRNNSGSTSLWLALSQLNSSRGESDKFAAKLIERGANPDAIDSRTGNSLLHLAALECNERAAIFLVCHGAKVNHTNHHGEAPIHIASKKGLHNLVQVLLQYGADPNLQTNLKTTPQITTHPSSQTPPISRNSPDLFSPTSTLGALSALSNLVTSSSSSLDKGGSPLISHKVNKPSSNPFDDDEVDSDNETYNTSYRISPYNSRKEFVPQVY